MPAPSRQKKKSRSTRRTRRKDGPLSSATAHPHAAGIDLGAESIVAAVAPERTPDCVRTFGSFTADLHELRDWLAALGITSVAMESTGNYWVPLYQILEDAGLEVFLVRARDVKAIAGRKTDVGDAQWLQHLHAAGLLRRSYRPAKQVAVLRYLMRHRRNLLQAAAADLQHMQKTLTECNLQLHHVFSDLDGTSARAIIEAILAGERDPETLAALRDCRCRTPKAQVLKALEGEYRAEYLFVLGQSYARWQQVQKDLQELDLQIQTAMAAITAEVAATEVTEAPAPAPVAQPEPPKLCRRRDHKNSLGFDIFSEAYRFYGVDLSAVPGFGGSTLAVLMSELGTGAQVRANFPTAKGFASWLRLCPGNTITGGKVICAKTGATTNPVTNALRLAAQAVSHTNTELGNLARRWKGKLGKAEGITATAHKLARIVYTLITTRQPYDEAKALALTPNKQARKLKNLSKQAQKLGFQLVPSTT